MSRSAVHAIALGVLAAVGLGIALLVSPVSPALTVEISLFVVAALVLAAIVFDIADALPSAEPVPLRRPPRPQRVGQLESVARALDLAEASAFDLHNTLRPIVREIAAARLARHRVSLDRQSERARAHRLLRAAQRAPVIHGTQSLPRSGGACADRDNRRR